jgi:glycosyltransferase involved in cell wall biosynthesis
VHEDLDRRGHRHVKTLIDAHMLGTGETGNETYVRGLLQGLLEIDAPQVVAVREAGLRELARETATAPPAHDVRVLRGSDVRRLLVELPGLARETGAALIHCTYIAPPRTPVPTVVTVHDASFARYPEAFTLRDRTLLRRAVPYAARRAAAVIAPSEHARSEIVDLLGVPKERVHVTPEACGREFRRLDEVERRPSLRRLGLERPYVLALGNVQPRKNLPRLLAAWFHLRGAGLLADHSLVVAGGTRGKREPLHQLIHDLGLKDDVVLPGYVAQADLPALYSGATVFVFPSLYEGFGLPPLEAMACGTAVACSNAASLPEVTGDAALLFDPDDPEAIAAAIGALLADDDARSTLAARGRQRAASFSWAACARATLTAYDAALA